MVLIELLAGKAENVVTELRLPTSATVGELRAAVGKHFGEVSGGTEGGGVKVVVPPTMMRACSHANLLVRRRAQRSWC